MTPCQPSCFYSQREMPQFSWPVRSSASSAKATTTTTTLVLFLLALLPQVWSIPQLLPDPRDRCAELSVQHPAQDGGRLVVINATFVEAHALNISGTLNALPFCRLASRLAYGSNDFLTFEVWLPDDVEYNGRFLAVGTFPSCTLEQDVTLRKKRRERKA
ncbi:hypothetical protein MPH_04462 [Macrophomina phaseolina MS6]|uniref:Uncharacterized protein n=1 Tax=Macrophomina phaseolina (strain MS6) TaxID=1126212 RepID=K2RZW6_MACPH|nr:hypothetical protein MPH_04462 [Macrophomina phaseolina MS6]